MREHALLLFVFPLTLQYTVHRRPPIWLPRLNPEGGRGWCTVDVRVLLVYDEKDGYGGRDKGGSSRGGMEVKMG